jgi:hypothetical protein
MALPRPTSHVNGTKFERPRKVVDAEHSGGRLSAGRFWSSWVFLICVEDPRKGGNPLSFLCCLAPFSSGIWSVDRSSGSRWSARSAARTNDLEADEDPPHTRLGGTRQRRCGSSHLLSPVTEQRGARDVLRVPAPSLIWVHGQQSGDMMIDGVPDARAAEGVRALILSGRSTQQRDGGRKIARAGRRHQLSYG